LPSRLAFAGPIPAGTIPTGSETLGLVEAGSDRDRDRDRWTRPSPSETYRATFGGALASRELGGDLVLIVTCLYTAVW